nr:hypothetical protein [Arthrobacter sp. 24S4-2]
MSSSESTPTLIPITLRSSANTASTCAIKKFPTTSNGYLDIIAFIAADRVIAVGVEGTGTYGAELTGFSSHTDSP